MRLIDADELEDTLGIEDRDIYVKATIQEAPTIDAVPVVRCKDCKFWELGCSCHFHKSDENGTPIHMKPDDFCSCGEKREADHG